MRKYKKQIANRLISLFLCVVMVVTLIPTTAFATGTTKENEVTSESEWTTEDETAVLENADEISEEESTELAEMLSEENAILEESTENSTVFDLGNGKKAVVFYSQDVRYEEDGELRDYDASLVSISHTKSENGEKLSDYKYENKAGDSKNYIPEKLDSDSQILMEKNDYVIKMLPLDDNIQGEMWFLRQKKLQRHMKR